MLAVSPGAELPRVPRRLRPLRGAGAEHAVRGTPAGISGQVMAVRLPARSGAPADIFLDRETHDAAWGAMRSGADLPFGPQPGAGLPGLGQQPAGGDGRAGELLLLPRRPGEPPDRAGRARSDGGCRGPEGAAAGRLYGVLGEAARSVRRRAGYAGDDGGGRRRGRRGDRPIARLGRPVPARLAGRGRLRAVPNRLRLALLRASLRRGARQIVRLDAPEHGAAR